MNGLQGLLGMFGGQQTPSTGMSPQMQAQALGMVPPPQTPQTGFSPQQQASMVTGVPMSNPTGLSPQQQAAAIGNVGQSGIPMDQIMAAVAMTDPTVFQAPDAPPAGIFNNAGNVMVAQPTAMKSMSSQLGPLMSMMGKK